jgi:hypothetical protein
VVWAREELEWRSSTVPEFMGGDDRPLVVVMDRGRVDVVSSMVSGAATA